ncbi:MAG: oxygen-dependent coproporphyrinogen oxidase [Bacteroidota bacterium]
MIQTTVQKAEIVAYLKALQDDICQQLENVDGQGKFQEDAWNRPGGGGGRSRVIHGALIEKGGVNFSAVEGKLPEKISQALKLPASQFFATGVSIVLHPVSPMVPIIHMNVRYFETENAENLGKKTYWFGGGIDLTPHYIVEEDSRFFHRSLKEVCDAHHTAYYPKFKQWADDYFYIKHRKETRGIGGIFYDRLSNQDGFTKDQRFAFMQSVGNAFCPIYLHLAQKNRDLPYGEQEKKWQMVRRGRYVEFNLVWDRGTKFGLDTDGRTESILMSMPPEANWIYNHQVEKGSVEAKTLGLLRKGVDWV